MTTLSNDNGRLNHFGCALLVLPHFERGGGLQSLLFSLHNLFDLPTFSRIKFGHSTCSSLKKVFTVNGPDHAVIAVTICLDPLQYSNTVYPSSNVNERLFGLEIIMIEWI